MKHNKTFDFTQFKGSPERLKWYRENYKKRVTQDEFVEAMQSLKRYSKSKQKHVHYTPSHLRDTYQNLVRDFNFFV